MSTSKEILDKAFRLKPQEEIPVGIFLGGSWPIIHSGLTLEGLIGQAEKTAKVFHQVNEKLDGDLIMVGTGATALLINALGGEIKFKDNGAPAVIGELIKTENDLSRLKVSDAIQHPAVRWLFETARHLSRLAGRERLILASCRAPFTLAAQLYGLENFSRDLYKKRTFAHDLLEFTTELSIAYFQQMIDEGEVHGVCIADPTASGDVISTRHFKEFVIPYLTRVVKVVKDKGKPVILHICGDITDRLSLIPETGVDCISLDTKVNLANAKNSVGDQICIAGNVDPVNILQFGTRTEVEDAVKLCISQSRDTGGFILLPGCDLDAGVSEENIKAFVDAARAGW